MVGFFPPWSSDEEHLLTTLRGQGMKGNDTSTQFPESTAMSCRKHYYEKFKTAELDKKTRKILVHLYKRYSMFKLYLRMDIKTDRCSSRQELWTAIAQQLNIPWQVVEVEIARLVRNDDPCLRSEPVSSNTP